MNETALKYYPQWMASKAGILDDLGERDGHHVIGIKGKSRYAELGRERYYDQQVERLRSWYECPCGGKDHLALRPWIVEGCSTSPAQVVTCFEVPGSRQWAIRPIDVAGTIRREEESYFRLMERAPGLVAKTVAKRGWNEQAIAFLMDTHGIDRELAESCYSELPT